MKKIILVTWLIGLHAFAALAIWDTDLPYRIDRKLGLGFLTPPEISRFYENMLGSHLQLDGSIEEGSVIFLGDSITQGLNVAAVTDKAINYGIGMDTSIGLLQRIPQYQSLNKASVIVVAIGINDFLRAKRSPSEVLSNYTQILDRLPTNTPIILQAPFPVDEAHGLAGTNIKISNLNTSLQGLAKQRNYSLINLQMLYSDKHGNLKDELHTGDGIHLSNKGYKLWIEALQPLFTASNS